MSTAGKVLISLILVFALVWIVAVAGVDQLDRNINALEASLNDQIATLSEQVKKVQHDVVANKDLITLKQEATDRELTRLRARQIGVERTRSQAAEILLQVKLELANLQDTVKSSKVAQDRRAAEVEAEEKAIAALGTELEALKATNSKMLGQIADLRDKFRNSYRASLDLVSRPTK